MSSSAFKTVEEKGMTIIEFDTEELREAVKPVWAELTANAPKTLAYADKISALIEQIGSKYPS